MVPVTYLVVVHACHVCSCRVFPPDDTIYDTGMPKALPAWLLPGPTPKKRKRAKAPQQGAAVSRRQKTTGTAEQPFAQSQAPLQPEAFVQLDVKLTLDAQTMKGVPNKPKPVEDLTDDAVKLAAIVKRPAKHWSVLQAKQSVAAAAVVVEQLLVVNRKSNQSVVTHRLTKGGKIVKRVNRFGKVKASERCGHCKTCVNRSMKKACLILRARMETAGLTVAIPDPIAVHDNSL